MGRERRDSRRKGELLAVVDLGSNAVRFLLAEVKPNAGYRVLVEERARTRLGAGAPGTLPRAAIDDTLRAVHRFFAHHVPNGGGPRMRATASACWPRSGTARASRCGC